MISVYDYLYFPHTITHRQAVDFYSSYRACFFFGCVKGKAACMHNRNRLLKKQRTAPGTSGLCDHVTKWRRC